MENILRKEGAKETWFQIHLIEALTIPAKGKNFDNNRNLNKTPERHLSNTPRKERNKVQ